MPELLNPQEIEALKIKEIKVGDDKDFLIAVARGKKEFEEKRQLMHSINGRFPIEQIHIEGSPLILLAELNNLIVVPNKERRSRSTESGALYYLRSKYNNPAVQIYFLPKGAETSLHDHQEHWEELIALHGDPTIIVNGQEMTLFGKMDADLNDKHMLRAEHEAAVIACITYGEGNCFDMIDHRYYPKPQFT